MAQTGYTPILIYSSSTASNAPAAGSLTNSTLGSELAINITDGKLFYKDNANAVQVIGWKTTPTTAGGTGLTSYTAGDLLYYASGTTLTKLAIGASGRYLASSGTAPQWNAPAALTKTDDTNVTLTLGGSASTALLNAASLTLGWTGQLAVTRGGTGIGSYTTGDLLYASGTTTLSKLGIGTANYVLTSSGSAPQWTAGSSVSVGTASNLLSNATTGVMQIVGPAASTTRVMTIPNANFTAARTDAAQTFTGLQQFNAGIQTNNETSLVFATTSSATGQKSIIQWLIEDGSEMSSIRSSRVNANGDGSLDFYTRGSGPSVLAAKINQFGTVRFERDNAYFAIAGKGVDFGSNSTAAGKTSTLLNWYEEGSYTPTLSSSGGTLTTTSATGYYTRVGRMVTINVEATLTNVGTATGALIVTLPYNTGNYKTAVGAGREDGATGVMLQAYAGPSSSTCAVFIYNNNTVLVNGYVAKFSLTYQV